MRPLNVTATPNSGDTLAWDYDLQENHLHNNGDMAWVLASTALVWLMIPDVGFFYSGLLRRKNALSMLWLSMISIAVVSFQWFFWPSLSLRRSTSSSSVT